MKKVTYYLIADQDVIDLYDEEGVSGLIDDDSTYSTFEFIEGETPSVDLAYALAGDYYSIISEYDYQRL